MNPKLVKFAVELQTGEKSEIKKEYIHFNNSGKHFFNISKAAGVTIPVNKR